MSYGQAMARLRRAITKVAANRLRPGGDRPGGLRRWRPESAYPDAAVVSPRLGKDCGWPQEKTLAQAAAGRPWPRGMLNCLDV
jgi:hypothetical protein